MVYLNGTCKHVQQLPSENQLYLKLRTLICIRIEPLISIMLKLYIVLFFLSFIYHTWALRCYALLVMIKYFVSFLMSPYGFQQFIIIYVNVKFNLNSYKQHGHQHAHVNFPFISMLVGREKERGSYKNRRQERKQLLGKT